MGTPRYFKIRRTTDGLFSTGGRPPDFNEKGKLWNSLSAVSGHISMVGDDYSGAKFLNSDKSINHEKYFHAKNPYLNCEIVEIKMEYSVLDNMFDFLCKRDIKRGKK